MPPVAMTKSALLGRDRNSGRRPYEKDRAHSREDHDSSHGDVLIEDARRGLETGGAGMGTRGGGIGGAAGAKRGSGGGNSVWFADRGRLPASGRGSFGDADVAVPDGGDCAGRVVPEHGRRAEYP